MQEMSILHQGFFVFVFFFFGFFNRPMAGFYSDLHQTLHKPSQGDPHHPLKFLSLVDISIWDKIVNVHTDIIHTYRQTYLYIYIYIYIYI